MDTNDLAETLTSHTWKRASGILRYAHSEHNCPKEAKEMKIIGKNRIGTSYYETLMVKTKMGPEKGNHELRNDLRGVKT